MTPLENERDCTPRWLPTEAEIAAACLEVQAGWTERERAKRAGRQHTGEWELPQVRSVVAEPAGVD